MEPLWLQSARIYIGTQEVVGRGSNPIIMGWAKRAGGWIASYFKDDDIPWCALFMEATLNEAGQKGTGSLAARSYEKWGVELEEPALGAILTFVRNGGGHVGYYVGENATAYRVLGGNQSNSVNETWISKDRCTSIRWPAGEPLPTDGPVYLNSKGRLSTNEASLGDLAPDQEFADNGAIDDTPVAVMKPQAEPMSPFRAVLTGINTALIAVGSGLAAVGAYLKMIPPEIWITLIICTGVFGTIIYLFTYIFPRPTIYKKFPGQG
jgi:uncharacterized protein (TIGR02594 family)